MPKYPVDAFRDSRDYFDAILADLRSDDTEQLDHADLEDFLGTRKHELFRLVYQNYLDLRAARERDNAAPVTGADGETRTEFRGSSRLLGTMFGDVTVHRLALTKHGISGGLFPMDARLNLPTSKHSLGVRAEVAWQVSQSSFEVSLANIRRTTGSTLGKRQVEDLAVLAVADFSAFYDERPREAELATDLMVLTFDGKGVVMRPEALRPETRKRAEKARAAAMAEDGDDQEARKQNRKRMAEVASVYSLKPQARTPADIMRELSRSGPHSARPRPKNKRVWASLVDSIPAVVDAAFYEALSRDEERERVWVALVDGNADQLHAIRSMSTNYGVSVTIVLDFIHVLEYLWAAGRALHEGQDKKTVRKWIVVRARRILEGRASHVAAGIRRSATNRGLTGTSRQKADACADYLLNHKQYLRYHEYLRDGLPIATGVIEGACRSLVRDRMDVTGARWGLEGGEAVLKLRSLRQSGDLDEYFAFHKRKELARNHLPKFHPSEHSDLRMAS